MAICASALEMHSVQLVLLGVGRKGGKVIAAMCFGILNQPVHKINCPYM